MSASIFDPPTGARTFNASDWLAGIDPPTGAPPIDDEPLPTWDTEPTTQPATRRRVRNLPIAVAAWLVIAGFIGAVIYPIAGWTPLLLIGLAVMTLELLIWLGLAWRFDRL